MHATHVSSSKESRRDVKVRATSSVHQMSYDAVYLDLSQ
jgi:hypothetical protein